MTKALRGCMGAALWLLTLCAAPSLAQNVDKAKWPARLTIVTGPTSGAAFPTGSAWASAVGAAVGVPISVEATTGLQVNPIMVDEKKADVAVSAGDTSLEAWNGGEASKGRQIRGQRVMVVLDPWVMQIYTTRRTGITKLADINGKTVNPSRRRSWTDNVLRDMVDVLALKPARITNVAPGDGNALMGDGRLDVSSVAGAIPHPAMSEFEVNHDMVLVGMTAEEQKKFLAKNPALSAFDIRPGSYKNQKEAVRTVASYNVYIVNKDLPEDLVYAMVKATFERKRDLAAAHKSFGNMDERNIQFATIPLHAGAARYFREKGIAIPDRLRPVP